MDQVRRISLIAQGLGCNALKRQQTLEPCIHALFSLSALIEGLVAAASCRLERDNIVARLYRNQLPVGVSQRASNELGVLDHLADESHWPGVPTSEAACQHVTAVLAEVWDALGLDPVAHAGIGVIPGNAQVDHAQ
ncbi:hypothetical protein AAIH00_12200 [Pseudomonas aeruginosa]|nr:hypothetical protein [Pseudomonas aeruginosa]